MRIGKCTSESISQPTLPGTWTKLKRPVANFNKERENHILLKYKPNEDCADQCFCCFKYQAPSQSVSNI